MLNFNLPTTIGGCLSTNMMLYGFGALAGLVVLSKVMKDSRPLLVSATKEVIAFRQTLKSRTLEFLLDGEGIGKGKKLALFFPAIASLFCNSLSFCLFFLQL